GSAASAAAASSSREGSTLTTVPPPPRGSRRGSRGGGPRLVDEEDGDVVADGVGVAAGAGAHQLRRGVVGAEPAAAVGAGEDFQEPRVEFQRHGSVTSLSSRVPAGHFSPDPSLPAPGHFSLTRARTSSRIAAIVASSRASALRRSSGSVLDGRRLNHHPGASAATARPSSSSIVTPGRPSNAARTFAAAAAWSATSLLISPDAAYRVYSASSSDSGRSCSPSAARTCRAASMPESANQKSRK